MAKLSLDDMIIKSRKLLDKLETNSSTIYTKEDYFIFSISKFVALKEMLVQKDSNTNTFYFDYRYFKDIYIKIKLMIDSLIETNPTIKIFVNNQEIDLTNEYVFGSKENINLPLNQKIIIENFNGSIRERNEIIRTLWIFNKIRDSFAHGTNIEFDMDNSKIKLDNFMNDECLGGFRFKLNISPELLNFVSKEKNEMSSPFDSYLNKYEQDKIYSTYIDYCRQYQLDKDLFYSKDNKKEDYFYNIYSSSNNFDKNIFKLIDESKGLIQERKSQTKVKMPVEDIEYISDIKVLKSILELISNYYKIRKFLSPHEDYYILSTIKSLIIEYSKEAKEDDKKAKQLLGDLNILLKSNTSNYFSVLYSHMMLLFSSDKHKRINLLYLKTTKIPYENIEYKNAIKKIIKKCINKINILSNSPFNEELYKECIICVLTSANEIEKIIINRNSTLLNNIRNGVMHKGCKLIADREVEITNCENTRDKNSINFSTTCSFENLSMFLKSIERPEEQNYSFTDLFEEIRNIVGESSNLEKYIMFYNCVINYLNSIKETRNEESSLN